MAEWYWYEQTGENTVRLLRIFGTSPVVVIPELINEKIVTGIGAYCFAEKERCISYELAASQTVTEATEEKFREQLEKERIRVLAGSYIKQVFLPKSITAIGNLCFYQCTELEEFIVGNALLEIGSDAFMNCRKLKKITIVGSVTEPSGLRQLLAQRTWETEVTFQKNGMTEAVLLYPEYTEAYDEIGPAHIFKLNIEGEGFRARQCFLNGVVDLVQYDAGFLQASVRESENIMCRMALQRLYYPAGLRDEYRKQYESYIKERENIAGTWLVQERRLEFLRFMGEQGYFSKKGMEHCILQAAAEGWTEGAGELLRIQGQYMGSAEEEEYSFEDI